MNFIIKFYVGEYHTWSTPTFTAPCQDLNEAILIRDTLIKKVANLVKVVIEMEPIIWDREDGDDEEVGEC